MTSKPEEVTPELVKKTRKPRAKKEALPVIAEVAKPDEQPRKKRVMKPRQKKEVVVTPVITPLIKVETPVLVTHPMVEPVVKLEPSDQGVLREVPEQPLSLWGKIVRFFS